MNRRFHIVLALTAVPVLWLGSARASRAGTIEFTFAVSGGSTLMLTGPPTTTTPVPGVFTGSGSSTPFGALTDSEVNQITFVRYPDRLAPGSESGNFTFSFNGGRDTFSGTFNVLFANDPTKLGLTDIQTRTILGGTGIFTGATGMLAATGVDAPNPGPPPPNAFNSFSGSGRVTAPGLAAVPEPASILLFGAGLAFVVLLIRRQD